MHSERGELQDLPSGRSDAAAGGGTGTRSGSVSWALLDQAAISGATFLTSILVARHLGLEEFGRFALATVALFVSQNVHGALVSGPMMIVGSGWPRRQRRAYLGAVLVHQAVYSVAAALLSFVVFRAADTIAPSWQLADMALPAALALGLGSASDALRHYFYARQLPRVSFLLDVVRYVLQLALIAAALLAGAVGLPGVLGLMALAALLSTLMLLLAMPRPSFDAASVFEVARAHWRQARWLLATSAVVGGREAALSVAVAAMLGAVEIGLLRVAQQMVMVVNVPLQGLGKLAQAGSSRAYVAGGRAALDDYTRQFILRYIAVIAALLCVIALGSGALIGLAYGEGYQGAAWLLTAFAGVMLVTLGREVAGIRLRAMLRPELEFRGGMWGAAMSLAFAVPLLAWFGLAGAVAAEAVFQAVALGAMIQLGERSAQELVVAPAEAAANLPAS